MQTGTVRWFSDAFGYGFIQDAGGNDVFVHYSVIQAGGYRSLDDGQVVEYEVTQGPKGKRATVVVPVKRQLDSAILSAVQHQSTFAAAA